MRLIDAPDLLTGVLCKTSVLGSRIGLRSFGKSRLGRTFHHRTLSSKTASIKLQLSARAVTGS